MSSPDIERNGFSETTTLSTAQVSRALGIGVSTVKRWVDDGVLPAHRTAGGHRKLLIADVVRLCRERNLPLMSLANLVAPERSQPADATDFLEPFLAAIRGPDEELIRSILHGAYQAGVSISALADAILGPAFRQVGDDWASGRITILHEHRITQSVVSALYELRGMLRGHADPTRPIAIGGAPEHDHTVLGTLLAKLTLLESGWNAVNLGPHTPVSAFRHAMDRFQPKLIWVSVNHLSNPESFLSQYQELYRDAHDRNIPVAVGGRGLSESLRTRMPYTTYGDGLTQLAAFARSLNSPPKRRTKAGRPLGRNRDAKNGS